MNKQLCAWASIDERGKVKNGQAGDQTDKEVKTGIYYDFGQTLMLRCNTKEIAMKIAKYAKMIAENDLVGYDQIQRTTSYNILEKSNWDISALTVPCEIDCSEMAAVAINLAFKASMIKSGVYSGNIFKAVLATNHFSGYRKETSPDKFSTDVQAGDIFIREGHHVIIAVQGNEVIAPINDGVLIQSRNCLAFQKAYNLDHPDMKIKEDGIIDNEITNAAKTICLKASYDTTTKKYKVGSKGHVVKFVQSILNIDPDEKFGGDTRLKVINWQIAHKECGNPDGCVGAKTIVSMINS